MKNVVPFAEYQVVADQLADARNEIAWLKGELGLVEDALVLKRLRAAFDLRPAEVRLLGLLYGARRRTVSRDLILDTIHETSSPDRRKRIADVWVCNIRNVIGHEAIETLWGFGYRLTPDGVAAVEACLRESEDRAA